MTTTPHQTTEQTGPLADEAEALLRRLVGRPDAELRDGQLEAVAALVEEGARVLVVQRTGWGKSAVYFLATALLRARGAGPTLIVSPLLALMRDQVDAARRAGLRAVTVNSANADEWSDVSAALAADEVDLLLVSPERLTNPRFRDEQLPRLAEATGLLVVDEAHCISDWGHDFRPDYRRIRDLLTTLPAGRPVLATTATANQRVVDDVVEQLGAGGAPVRTVRGSLARASLRLGVLALPTADARLGWLAARLGELPGSGIVYTLTVAGAEDTAALLREAGHDVRAYTGRTDPADRLDLERALRDNEVKALVATSALGMGFDATLGFVVNMGAPASPVAYYQQVGRAGRGTGLPPEGATVVLLPAIEDRDIWAYFASLAFPREELVRQTIDILADQGRPLSTAALETYVELNRNRLETMLKVLDVDGAVRRVRGGWEATGQAWAYDEERYRRVTEAREREQAAMLAYLDTERCRMWFLRDQLDDPEATECGRCDNCGGLGLSADVSAAAVEEAGARLSRPGVVIEPRKMWPSALVNLGVDLKGKISDGAGEGRAVARLTDLGYGQALRELFRPGQPDVPVPVPLVRAVVEVLGDWRPAVDGIVVVESATRPTLTADLADGLSRYLKVPVLGRYAITDPTVEPGQGAMNSAQRVAAVGRRYRLDAEELGGRRVLLVDDLVVTGWTLTLAARAVRRAGAEAVLPLALALQA